MLFSFIDKQSLTLSNKSFFHLARFLGYQDFAKVPCNLKKKEYTKYINNKELINNPIYFYFFSQKFYINLVIYHLLTAIFDC